MEQDIFFALGRGGGGGLLTACSVRLFRSCFGCILARANCFATGSCTCVPLSSSLLRSGTQSENRLNTNTCSEYVCSRFLRFAPRAARSPLRPLPRAGDATNNDGTIVVAPSQ